MKTLRNPLEWSQNQHVFLIGADHVGIADNGRRYGVTFQKARSSLDIGVRLRHMQFLDDEWAFGVPSHDHLLVFLVPHHRDRVEPAVQRTVVIDAALAAFRIERGTDEPFPVRHEADFRSGVVRKGIGRYARSDGRLDLLSREVRAKRTLELRKTTAHIARRADRTGNDLLDSRWKPVRQ